MLFIFFSSVLSVEDSQNLSGHVSMQVVMIIVIKDIGEECLGFHVVESTTAINIMLVEDRLDILDTVSLALLSLLCLAEHILVKDVCSQQVCEEVEAHEHEEHEEECVEEVDVHGWEEDVGEVRRREQDRHVSVGILDRTKVLEAFEG